MIPHPYPPGAAEAFIERALSPAATELVWALDTGADDENGLIGLISLKPRDAGEAEIGYWVAPAFWNTGYASEAVEGRGRPGRPAPAGATLVAEVFQDNPASARVLLARRLRLRGRRRDLSRWRGRRWCRRSATAATSGGGA